MIIKRFCFQDIPKYECEITNTEQLDESGQTMNYTVQDFTDSSAAVNPNQALDDLEEARSPIESHQCRRDEQMKSDYIFRCPNSLCVKKFIRESAYQHHIHNTHSKCIVRKSNMSQTSALKMMYISKNGCAPYYQQLSFPERRSLRFHLHGMPTVDEEFIGAHVENCPKGFALPKRRVGVTLNDKQTKYLKEIFETGLQKGNKKANSAVVSKEMRSVVVTDANGEQQRLFSPEEWLTEARIKSHFSKLAASKRFSTDTPNRDQVEDSCSVLDMCQKTQDAIDVARHQEDADSHPIVIQKIDVCSLAGNLCTTGVHAQGMADLSAIKTTKLRKVVKEMATDMPKRLTSHKAAAIITQYVRDNCDCLPLTAFEKWKDGVKQSLNKESRVNLLE